MIGIIGFMRIIRPRGVSRRATLVRHSPVVQLLGLPWSWHNVAPIFLALLADELLLDPNLLRQRPARERLTLDLLLQGGMSPNLIHHQVHRKALQAPLSAMQPASFRVTSQLHHRKQLLHEVMQSP